MSTCATESTPVPSATNAPALSAASVTLDCAKRPPAGTCSVPSFSISAATSNDPGTFTTPPANTRNADRPGVPPADDMKMPAGPVTFTVPATSSNPASEMTIDPAVQFVVPPRCRLPWESVMPEAMVDVAVPVTVSVCPPVTWRPLLTAMLPTVAFAADTSGVPELITARSAAVGTAAGLQLAASCQPPLPPPQDRVAAPALPTQPSHTAIPTARIVSARGRVPHPCHTSAIFSLPVDHCQPA